MAVDLQEIQPHDQNWTHARQDKQHKYPSVSSPVSQSAIQYRAANVNDASSIAKLGRSVFSLTFGFSVEPHELEAYLDEAYTPEAIRDDILNPSIDLIVATAKTPTELDIDSNVGNIANGRETNSNTIEAREEILGFVQLTRGTTDPCLAHLPSTSLIELQRIYVCPEHHGSGIGKSLARCAETIARSYGFHYMWLGVWEENIKAQAAYQKWGYEVVGGHDFTIGTVVQHDLILVKQLKAQE